MFDLNHITKNDIDEVILFYEKYLNSGGTIRKAIRTAFENNCYFGCKAADDGDTIGFFTFQEGVALTYPHVELEQEILSFTKTMQIATVDALMVDRRFRERGVAREMAKWSIRELTRRKFTAFLVEVWVYPDGSYPAAKVYEQMGNVIWKKEIPLFYQEAHKYGISCPICGERCQCGAVLEIITI